MKVSFKEVVSDWRAYLAEFLGTFFFVFISSSIVISDSFYNKAGIAGVSLGIGFCYSALVFVTSHLAGGYLNPAITVSLWLVGKLSHIRTTLFLFGQICASFAAAYLVLFIFGENALQFSLGAPVLGIGVNLTNAVALEAILTAILTFVIFSTSVDRSGPVSFTPIAAGLFLVAAMVLALPITGGALNPARALGPEVISHATDTLAVWVVGPLAGSLVGVVYELVFLRKRRN